MKAWYHLKRTFIINIIKLLKALKGGIKMGLMEELRTYEELVDFSDTIDSYQEDYAQMLLDDDALEIQEVAFLKGYRDSQL